MKQIIAALAAIFTLSTAVCSANCPENFLLFGDSYFDTGAGNTVATQQGVPLPNPSPPYFDNRHSNGPIWIDYVSQNLNIPVIDFAVAGSQTGTGNVNTAQLGGLVQQLARYQSSTSKVPKNTIVIVDGAGNDYLGLIPAMLNPAAVATTTQTALTNLAGVFTSLQDMGADKIVVWNLGDLGKLPLFNNPIFGPLLAAKPLFTAASNAFNTNLPTAVVQKLNNFKKPNQVFIFDAHRVFNEVALEFIANGVNIADIALISNYGGPYIPTGLDPNVLAFYDQVHPTTLAWSIFANSISAYLDTLIEAPRFMASETDLALETAKAHRDLVENHFRTLNVQRYIYGYWNDCCCDCNCCDSCIQIYADGEGKWGQTETRCGAFGLKYDTGLALLGADLRVAPNLLIGASFTAQTTTATVKEGRGHMKLNDYIPTIYASYFGPCYFVDLASSLHVYRYHHIKRNVPYVNRVAHGHTEALAGETSLTAGYVGTCNCFTYMPIVGFDFQELTVDRYKERCAGYYNMGIRRQHQRSFVGRLGAQLFWNGLGCILPFAEVAYEYEFLRNAKRIGPYFRQSDDNAQAFHHTGTPNRNVLKYSLGVDARLWGCIVGNISYVGETNFDFYNNAVRAQVDVAF